MIDIGQLFEVSHAGDEALNLSRRQRSLEHEAPNDVRFFLKAKAKGPGVLVTPCAADHT
jgi:hypothetical protein